MFYTLINKRWMLCCVLVMFSISTTSLCSAHPISISRYQTVPLSAKHEQIHLLQQAMQIQFPSNVVTIEQAIRFSLQFSGFHLVKTKHLPRALLKLPLPEINRQVGPIRLQQLLQLLAGPAFTLKIDPAHRLISFSLKKQYHHLYD